MAKASLVAHQIHQGSHADTGWADRQISFVADVPGRACNVQMHPQRVFNEFADEVALADGFDVGSIALDMRAILFVQRPLPELFARLLACRQYLRGGFRYNEVQFQPEGSDLLHKILMNRAIRGHYGFKTG